MEDGKRMLGPEAFERAGQWVDGNARPLDRALFALYFRGGEAGAVTEALAAFRNPDGGFGHALEPDFRLEESTPLATTVGFQYLVMAGAPAGHPLVQGGIDYFLRTYDRETGRWEKVTPGVNDVPRAFWWEYDAEEARKPGFQANPGAEIVGYLHRYRELAPAAFLYEVTERAMGHLREASDEMEMHDALCYLRMEEALPSPLKEAAREKLLSVARKVVSTDPEAWGGYGVTPLLFAPSPDSFLAEEFRRAIETNLDYQIGQQTEEGCWTPNWSWGRFEEVWPTAEHEWKGHLTVSALKTLKDYGRIPGLHGLGPGLS